MMERINATGDPAETAATDTPAPDPSGQGAALAREYLTFQVGPEEYAIDILAVQEIRRHEPPTRIAGAPAHIKGVINLRGVVLPIVDLRVRLGCDQITDKPTTVCIVLKLGNRMVGVVVDGVTDVSELPSDAIKPAPEMASAVDAAFVSGLAKLHDRMLIVLDIVGMVNAPSFGLSH
ncbi:MAG: chemotaxis protein CheW [Caldimonas sp.]|uniref:chemotaxis protein CheW n=1 Tax=Caldimonas sp. TaxID=2838790 RepID=UPI00391CAD8C